MAFPEWYAVSRTPGLQLGVTLPVLGVQAVLRHLGVGTAVLTTSYTPERWASLAPAYGLVLYRNGLPRFSGLVTSRTLTWDRDNAEAIIKVEALDDITVLAQRLTFPDPLRAPDDQTVNDYWMTRTGTTPASVPASTAMWRLISDQAGPTCAASRRVTGLVMGADPAVGTSRIWSALFADVLGTLTTMSVASGQNLGVRMTPGAGSLTANVVVPANNGIKFSADLSNLVGFTYREEAPTVTNAVAAGQGDLKARLRKTAATADPLATAWAIQRWSYVDRRDTADPAELATAAGDEVTKGGPKVSLAVELTDSQAASWITDWDLGSIVTVYVGLPDQTRVATVTDVVREISVNVDPSGAETIQPAIGTYDATAVIPTPTQSQLARVGAALGNLIAGK